MNARGEQGGEVVKMVMRELTGLAIKQKETGVVARVGGLLGDQTNGELIVEIGELHTPSYDSIGCMWFRLGLVGLVVLIGAGLLAKEARKSLVINQTENRFNLLLIKGETGGVDFISLDPVERRITSLTFNREAKISARQSGEYDVSSLYKLGDYQGGGGQFARRKVQGYLRVPIPGYLWGRREEGDGRQILRSAIGQNLWGKAHTNLSKLDLLLLWYRARSYRFDVIEDDELARVGAIVTAEGKVAYVTDRLREYVATRFVDWSVGESQLSVAIVNASGEDGLGRDTADFLENLGIEVVMVRSSPSDTVMDQSKWQAKMSTNQEQVKYVFTTLLGLGESSASDVPDEYRADVLLTVGADAKELF